MSASLYNPYDDQIRSVISEAVDRLSTTLHEQAPSSYKDVVAWMRRLSNADDPVERLMGPKMYPFLLIPWWLKQGFSDETPDEFDADIIYAAVNAYYAIRLVDDVMDADLNSERKLLPATFFFQSQVLETLSRHFEPSHSFWQVHNRYWIGSADHAIADAISATTDRASFERISSRKTCASLIPVSAVCHQYDRLHLMAPWTTFCEQLGQFHQMLDDLVDWHVDERCGRSTFVLSVGLDQKRTGETMFSWFLRDGYRWGFEELERLLCRLEMSCASLKCIEAEEYLDARRADFLDWKRGMLRGVNELNKLKSVFHEPGEESS